MPVPSSYSYIRPVGLSRAWLVLACGLFLSGMFFLSRSAAASLTDELDAMWANSRPIARDRCLYFIVKAWPDPALRGRVSPHDCVVYALQEYRRGDHEHAMGWLQAGLCPDREAQQRLMREAPFVFDYLLKHFGSLVPEAARP